MTRDEFKAVKKLYNYEAEKPTAKPPPPVAPAPLAAGASYEDRQKHGEAVKIYEIAVRAHANWADPMPLMQAGADRNAMRHAEADGLRLLAWIAQYVSAGEDPLKTLVQIASDAGFDVDPEDVTWAEEENADEDA